MGYDPIGLRPATVEELAAQERAVPRHRRTGRRPLLIMLATLVLLIGGAGALALARSDPPIELVQPYGPDAPFGVDYVDGFGEHSPKPTPRASGRKARTALSPAQPAMAMPSTTSIPSTPSTPSAPSAPSAPSTTGSPDILSSQMSAVQWSRVFNGKYETYVWVHNGGTAPAAWEVRVRLPQGATVTGSSAVQRTFVNGQWMFTPTKGKLGAGLVYLFSFSGATGPARFSLKSCTVNGSYCDPFR